MRLIGREGWRGEDADRRAVHSSRGVDEEEIRGRDLRSSWTVGEKKGQIT